MTVPERKLIAKAWIEAAKDYNLTTIIQIGAGSLRDTQDLVSTIITCHVTFLHLKTLIIP